MVARNLLLLGGGGFLVFGAWALIEPVGLWQALDLPVADLPAVRTELRAYYGGLGLGLGALLLSRLRKGADPRSGLRLMLWAYGALALGRLAGLALDRAFTAVHLSAFAIEAALALAAAAALRPSSGSA